MILVLNCGSQSLKYKLFDDNLKPVKEKKISINKQKDYQGVMMRELGELKKYDRQIKKICHRVVHGGEKFRDPILITEKNLKELEKYNKLAPCTIPSIF